MEQVEQDVDLRRAGRTDDPGGHREEAMDKLRKQAEDETSNGDARAAALMRTNSVNTEKARQTSHDLVGQELDEQVVSYSVPGPANLLPPPDFKPFFALIEDGNGELHHPFVHYIFADDDLDSPTDVALETLSERTSQNQPMPHRVVLIDMAANGKDVTSASSLSPEWQALTTKVSPAPSWSGDNEGKGSAERGTMLTIYGHEAGQNSASAKGKKGHAASAEEALKAFDLNLDTLDGVLRAAVKSVEPLVTEDE